MLLFHVFNFLISVILLPEIFMQATDVMKELDSHTLSKVIQLCEHLQLVKALEQKTLEQRYFRLEQLQRQSSNYHLQDFFYDLDSTISLSNLYNVIDMDSTWTQWTLLKDDALQAFSNKVHASSTTSGIKVHGRPYTSNDLSPSGLLLVKNREFNRGFYCTQLLLFGDRRVERGFYNITSSGIVFNYHTSKNKNDMYYTVMIDTKSQSITLSQYQKKKKNPISQHKVAAPMGIIPLRMYSLAVDWNGSFIRVYLDGENILSVKEETTGNSGTFGVFIGQGNAHFYSISGGIPVEKYLAPQFCFHPKKLI